jgi:serine/threonine protein kinase
MERVTQEAQGQAGETPAVAPLVDNRYQLVSRLRAEATGAIYQARDTRQGGMVLLQEIPRALSLHFDLYFGEFKRRFHQLQGIRHAAVMLPKGHIYDREQDRHFLLFDYEDSVPLKAYMARQSRGVLAVSDALALCSRIATALDHIHIQGMVHGDLRVANVLLRPAASPGADRRPAEHETLVRGMAVRLSGCALNHEIRSIVLRAAPDLGQPLISTLLAEDAFSSAPERWLSIRASGDSAITTRTLFHDATLRIRPAAPTAASDIYALAELFYTMVTGSQPLAPGHAAMDPATVDALAAIPDLGERGNRLLRQALAPDPARRPKRATAMIHAMEEEMRTQMLSPPHAPGQCASTACITGRTGVGGHCSGRTAV